MSIMLKVRNALRTMRVFLLRMRLKIRYSINSWWRKEALPKEEEFLQAYKDTQKESVLVYNSVHESNPDCPLANPIREVNRIPGPPEIAQAFTGADRLIQNVLGSYDASLGINNNQLSGIAIVEAASQSNATAMPYIVGCLQGFQTGSGNLCRLNAQIFYNS